jgi:hypothetical protein
MRFDLSSKFSKCIPELFGNTFNKEPAVNCTNYYQKPKETLCDQPYAADLLVKYQLDWYRYIPDNVLYMLFKDFQWLSQQKSKFYTRIINHHYCDSATAIFCGHPVYIEMFDLQSGRGMLYMFDAYALHTCIGTVLYCNPDLDFKVSKKMFHDLLTKTEELAINKIKRNWQICKYNPKYAMCRKLLCQDLDDILRIAL